MSSPYNQELGDPTQAARFDDGKPRVELVPPELIEGTARGFSWGAEKYDEWNWAKGFPPVQPVASLLRHIMAWLGGEDMDPESGLHHFDHMGANIAMLLYFEKHGIGEDLRCRAVLEKQREEHGRQEKTETPAPATDHKWHCVVCGGRFTDCRCQPDATISPEGTPVCPEFPTLE